jgi:hypothetical protein
VQILAQWLMIISAERSLVKARTNLQDDRYLARSVPNKSEQNFINKARIVP